MRGLQFCEHELDTEPRPIDQKHGFSTLYPGQTVSKEVEVWVQWWWKQDLKAGEQYSLRLPWAHDCWWDVGATEVNS